MLAAMLIPFAAGLASAAVSHGVHWFTPASSPSHWVVSDFAMSSVNTTSFFITFDGVAGKAANCSGPANVWTPCEGTLNSEFKIGDSNALSLMTNLTQNNAQGLLYSIDEGVMTAPNNGSTFNVPLLRVEDFYTK